jgi:hypothetical protein
MHEQGLRYADDEGNLVFLPRDFQTQAATGAYVQREEGVIEMVLGSEPSLGWFYWLRGGKYGRSGATGGCGADSAGGTDDVLIGGRGVAIGLLQLSGECKDKAIRLSSSSEVALVCRFL